MARVLAAIQKASQYQKEKMQHGHQKSLRSGRGRPRTRISGKCFGPCSIADLKKEAY